MTALEAAYQMGNARSSAAYNLNKLVRYGLLEKFPGK